MRKAIPIIQLTKSRRVVNIYNSAYQCCKESNGELDFARIRECCNHQYGSYKGYIFMDLEEFINKHPEVQFHN